MTTPHLSRGGCILSAGARGRTCRVRLAHRHRIRDGLRRHVSSTTSSVAPSTGSGTTPIREPAWCRTAGPRNRSRAWRPSDSASPPTGIGAERGWVTRSPGGRAQRSPRCASCGRPRRGPEPAGRIGYRGFFYHFLAMDTGLRFEKVELSTIDTGLLMAGVLFVQSYFDRSTPVEREIRTLADSLYHRRWSGRSSSPTSAASR